MRSYAFSLCGLLMVGALVAVAGCAQDEPVPASHRNLGTEPGEILVPYGPVPDRKAIEDPSQFPLPAPTANLYADAPAAVGAPADGAVAVANQVVDALIAGQFGQVAAVFDETMAAQLPEAQLQTTWEGLVAQAGQVQQRGEPQTQQAQGMTVVVVPVTFENGAANVQVAVNEQGQVTGLFIMPADGAAGATDSPAAPGEAPAAAAQGRPAGRTSGQPSSGSSRGMDMLPPTAPAPIGLGN